MSAIRSDCGISVFFPAFNDAVSIETLVGVALKILPRLTNDYEVIVVNDGSTDATAAVLERLTRTHANVRIIHHERNLGYGAALQTGFRQAKKELVFYTDGDGQYDVSELPMLHRLLTDEVDIVNGYKLKRSDNIRRKLLGAIYNQTARFLFRLPIRDVDCDFRLLRRKCIQELEIHSTTGAVCVELVSKLHRAGCVFVETPVHHHPRIHGDSQFFTFRRVLDTAVDFSRLWWRMATTNNDRNVRSQPHQIAS
jgi:glycosyltransferase involved in cell wall biosynthesis